MGGMFSKKESKERAKNQAKHTKPEDQGRARDTYLADAQDDYDTPKEGYRAGDYVEAHEEAIRRGPTKKPDNPRDKIKKNIPEVFSSVEHVGDLVGGITQPKDEEK